MKIGTTQIRTTAISSDKKGFTEVCVHEASHMDVSPTKIGTFEICVTEISVVEERFTEVGITQIGST